MAKKKILLVEDEADLVEMIKLRLEANGYDVIIAYDGEAALEQVRQKRPDLILLDIMLPKIDGYKVCKLLKNDEKYKHIPIAMFTARAQESEQKRGMGAGADGYIIKPFEPAALLSKIKELLKS